MQKHLQQINIQLFSLNELRDFYMDSNIYWV